MSNPVFRQGPITFDVTAHVEKFRFVKLEEKGVSHAGASDAVFGAVSSAAVNGTAGEWRTNGDLRPTNVAVHFGPAAVLIEAADSEEFTVGAPVYAAADGKASASGTTAAGVAVRPAENGFVTVLLTGPAVA